MILLSKLDKSPILINLDSIKYIESVPDTIIFFINGDSIIVRENLDEIRLAVLKYKKRIFNDKD